MYIIAIKCDYKYLITKVEFGTHILHIYMVSIRSVTICYCTHFHS